MRYHHIDKNKMASFRSIKITSVELAEIYTDSPKRIKRDVVSLLRSPLAKGLEASFTSLTLNDGTHFEKVLLFQGNTVIQYRSVNCSLPIDIYLPPKYPSCPPMCFIRPTNVMVIRKNHDNVSSDGEIKIPYLTKWSKNVHTLTEMISSMISLFAIDPPVFSKPEGCIDSFLFFILAEQKIIISDRSHPNLCDLDSYHFNYLGWQFDFAKAQLQHVRNPSRFERSFDQMKEKQQTSSTFNLITRKWTFSPPSTTSPSSVTPENNTHNECIICLQHPRTHAFVPCGHLCICNDCVRKTITHGSCPVCRVKTTQVMKVFFS